MKRENKLLLGIGGFLGALILSFAFVVLAIRKKSVLGALCAFAAAAGSSASIGVLLTELFAPDTDGERVTIRTEKSDEELFSADEVADAIGRVHQTLGTEFKA